MGESSATVLLQGPNSHGRLDSSGARSGFQVPARVCPSGLQLSSRPGSCWGSGPPHLRWSRRGRFGALHCGKVCDGDDFFVILDQCAPPQTGPFLPANIRINPAHAEVILARGCLLPILSTSANKKSFFFQKVLLTPCFFNSMIKLVHTC